MMKKDIFDRVLSNLLANCVSMEISYKKQYKKISHWLMGANK